MRHLSLSLVAACVLSAGADASNSSSVKELGIEVHFTQCTHLEAEEVEDAAFCGEEVWVLHVAADGWQAEHANVVRGTAGRWTATCSEGVYRADIDGKIWPGTCRVTGDQDHLCFETQSTTGPGDFGGEQTQCFEVSGDTCLMDLQGKVWLHGVAGEIVNRYAVSSRDVTICRILDR
jgi:hypothetical protein